jgi:hypothetical protein
MFHRHGRKGMGLTSSRKPCMNIILLLQQFLIVTDNLRQDKEMWFFFLLETMEEDLRLYRLQNYTHWQALNIYMNCCGSWRLCSCTSWTKTFLLVKIICRKINVCGCGRTCAVVTWLWPLHWQVLYSISIVCIYYFIYLFGNTAWLQITIPLNDL